MHVLFPEFQFYYYDDPFFSPLNRFYFHAIGQFSFHILDQMYLLQHQNRQLNLLILLINTQIHINTFNCVVDWKRKTEKTLFFFGFHFFFIDFAMKCGKMCTFCIAVIDNLHQHHHQRQYVTNQLVFNTIKNCNYFRLHWFDWHFSEKIVMHVQVWVDESI